MGDARFLRSDLQTNRSHSVVGPFMIRLRWLFFPNLERLDFARNPLTTVPEGLAIREVRPS